MWLIVVFESKLQKNCGQWIRVKSCPFYVYFFEYVIIIILSIIKSRRDNAYRKANEEQIMAYFELGKIDIEKHQKHK